MRSLTCSSVIFAIKWVRFVVSVNNLFKTRPAGKWFLRSFLRGFLSSKPSEAPPGFGLSLLALWQRRRAESARGLTHAKSWRAPPMALLQTLPLQHARRLGLRR